MTGEIPERTREISGRTRVVGVWGHPVGHSRSPVMHNAALAALGLDWVYTAFDVPPLRIADAVAGVRGLGLVGVNVTVPLKELLPPLLDSLSDEARRIGAVNTIVNKDGVLHGDSTDGGGFLRALAEAGGPSLGGARALLLGAGGSARAVAFALAGAGCEVVVANRTEEKAQALADAVTRAGRGQASSAGWGAKAGPVDLIVNATSLGLAPQINAMPALPPGVFDTRPFVYDLIYSPPETRLLQAAREAGCPVSNGLGMLVWQGALSLSLWTGRPLAEMPVIEMAAALAAQACCNILPGKPRKENRAGFCASCGSRLLRT